MSDLLRRMMGYGLMDQAAGDAGASGGGAAGTENAEAGADDGGNLMKSVIGGEQEGAGGEEDKQQDVKGAQTPEQQALDASEKDIRRPKHVPAKFWNAEKGEVNFEAWANSTRVLEQRIRDVGMPPKSADEYKFDPPEELKALGVDADPALTKQFRDEALGMGLTQKQYEKIMGKYYAMIPQIAGAAENFGRARCEKSLNDFYKTPDAVKSSVMAAFKTYAAYADEEEMKAIDSLGNNPYFIRVLAKINREMTEDSGVTTEGIATPDDIEELMAKGSPYWDSGHPQHKAVKAKVTAYYERQARLAQRKRAA